MHMSQGFNQYDKKGRPNVLVLDICLYGFVDGTLFIPGGPPRDCRNIVVQILISVEVRLFQ